MNIPLVALKLFHPFAKQQKPPFQTMYIPIQQIYLDFFEGPSCKCKYSFDICSVDHIILGI